MSAFTLEIVRRGETPAVADVVTIPSGRLIWRQVEALALLVENPDGAFIRVKNEKAETIIRAGVRTTLASIHHCPCTGCPLKKALAKRAAAEADPGGDASSFDKTTLYPCEAGAREARAS